jgi:LPXTG-site transpeptidase (sortase) family protein
MNPLFAEEPGPNDDKSSYILSRTSDKDVKPIDREDNPAVEMLRRKLDALYDNEPSAKKEVEKVAHIHPPRSKHQEFMHRLTTTGKSMAEIQTAWHDYYAKLPDHQKHEVWQEFYSANAKKRRSQITDQAEVQHQAPKPEGHPKPATAQHKAVVSVHEHPGPLPAKPGRSKVATAKKRVLTKVRSRSNTYHKAHQHLKSLAFGLSLGALALLVALFGLFNELVVTPFIQPGSAAATPIILNANEPAPSDKPEAIIPKLNAQLPVVYSSQSIAEEEVQKALENGVFHYPTTASPGQNGNVAIFGHSSNNIFSKGDYKFAFVLLRELEPGDIFYLTYEGKVYTYKVFNKEVVNPDETWVLGPVEGKQATAALITCDPPGSTRHRLVVWGEQITPSPSGNTTAAEPSEALQTQDLPGKAPTAWTRFWEWLVPF